ncbi:hypothetical protein [Azospirillum largimobile]
MSIQIGSQPAHAIVEDRSLMTFPHPKPLLPRQRRQAPPVLPAPA